MMMLNVFKILFFVTLLPAWSTVNATDDDPFAGLEFNNPPAAAAPPSFTLNNVEKNHISNFCRYFELPLSFETDFVIPAMEQVKDTLATKHQQHALPQAVDFAALYYYNKHRAPELFGLLIYAFLLTPKTQKESLFETYNSWNCMGTEEMNPNGIPWRKDHSRTPMLMQFVGLKDFLLKLPYRPELWSGAEGIESLQEKYSDLQAFQAAFPLPETTNKILLY